MKIAMTALLSALLFIPLAQPVIADEAAHPGSQETFDRLDRDRDDQLDVEEIGDYGVSETDTDAPTGEPDRRERMLEQFDKNNDGVISRGEFYEGWEGPPKETRGGFEAEDSPAQ